VKSSDSVTTGMPHRPTSSDGHYFDFPIVNPYRAALSLVEVVPVAMLASASLSEASVRLAFLPSLTAEGRCGMDSTESQVSATAARELRADPRALADPEHGDHAVRLQQNPAIAALPESFPGCRRGSLPHSATTGPEGHVAPSFEFLWRP
jgi:hypothetical protein